MTNEFAGTGNGELLKSLVSISDAINEQIFNANQTIDGSFINRQAIIADTDPIENLKVQIEKYEQEDEDKSVLQEAEEALTQLREEQERAREEAWDNSMHNVAGMDLSGVEIDGIIDTIKNPLRKAEIIAKRAKDKNISPEEAEKQLNMTLAYLDAKKKVDNHTATANDIATVHDVERSPEKSAIVRDNINYAQNKVAGLSNANSHEVAVSITQGNQEAMNNRASFLSVPTAISAASEIDGKTSNLTITNNFNSNAGGIKAESVAEPINAIPALEQRQLASMGVAASNAI